MRDNDLQPGEVLGEPDPEDFGPAEGGDDFDPDEVLFDFDTNPLWGRDRLEGR